jgi:hypothetical protein
MNRIKFSVLLVITGLVSAAAHGEAPELRTVMPNSWQKVTRLPQKEETEFLINNRTLLDRIVLEAEEPFGRRFNIKDNIYAATRVYQDRTGEDTFYRLLTVNSKTPDFTHQWEIIFLQTLVYNHQGKPVILAMSPYNSRIVGENYYFAESCSIDIIRAGNRAKGIMVTQLNYSVSDKDRDTRGNTYTKIVKGQIPGFVTARYILMGEIIEALNKNTRYKKTYEYGLYVYAGVSEISITGTPCLVDPDIPLRYGLQSAFDGDPSSSYVENTEDDLMRIDFTYAGYEKIKRIAIINGYTQNSSLYKKNNRIKSIGIETLEWNEKHSYLIYILKKEEILKDNYLSYQFFDVEFPAQLKVTSIYNGSTYNDTCIAELNVKTDQGWLFGDING